MKNKRRFLLRWVACLIISFLTIYVVVFFSGIWKLFESGKPLFIEIGAAILFSIVLLIFSETYEQQNEKIKMLEERIENLEANIEKS